MVAAGVLLHTGIKATVAFQIVSKARGLQMPETEQQFNWVVANQKAIIGNTKQVNQSRTALEVELSAEDFIIP